MGDHVAILQFAYYSVISPEGCAGILWKDGKRAEQAARALKLTSSDLLKMQIVDEVIPEPLGGAHRDHRAMAAILKQSLQRAVQRLSLIPIPQTPGTSVPEVSPNGGLRRAGRDGRHGR